MFASEKKLLDKFLSSEGGREILDYYVKNLAADEKYFGLIGSLSKEVGVGCIIN